MGNALRVGINADDFFAMRSELSSQRASATADIKCALTVWWKCTKNKPMVVGVVVPAHPRLPVVSNMPDLIKIPPRREKILSA